MAKVAQNEPNMIPSMPGQSFIGQFSYLGGYSELNLSWLVGVKWGDPSMKLYDLEQTDFYKSLYQRFHRWYVNGYYEKDVIANKEDPTALQIAGRVASRVTAFDLERTTNASVMGTHPTWKFKAYLVSVDKVAPLAPPLNNALFFNANGANPIKALKFWEWVHKSQDNYDLFIYGIKGRDYTLTSDGAVQLPAGVNLDDSPYLGWHGQWAAWWPELSRPEVTDEPGWMKKLIKGTYINEKNYPTMGFSPNTEAFKNELAQRLALRADFGTKLEFGVVDPDVELKNYLDKQKAAGSDKILAELQKQMDAWNSANK
jgi:putative aldouronate transport system substrate-binding protein